MQTDLKRIFRASLSGKDGEPTVGYERERRPGERTPDKGDEAGSTPASRSRLFRPLVAETGVTSTPMEAE